MPSLTDFQNSTIKILDYLHFQDILSIQSFTKEKLDFYDGLVDFINIITDERGLSGYRSEHYKHLLLCGIDANILRIERTNDLLPQDAQNKIILLWENIEREVRKASFNLHHFWYDLDFLLAQYPLNKMSNALRYKIVNQVLNYEYDNLTEVVFSKFLDYGFLKLAKYKKNYQKISQEFIDKALFRAMLYLEYEAFRNNLLLQLDSSYKAFDLNNINEPTKAISVISARSKVLQTDDIRYDRIYHLDLEDSNALKKYFSNLSDRLGHNSILFDNVANISSLIGAWHVIRAKKLSLDSENELPYDRAIYRETPTKDDNTEQTCTEIAKQEMLDFGFTVSERALFDTYDKVFPYYEFIRVAINDLNENRCSDKIELVLTYYMYYDPNLEHSKFKEVLEEILPKLKKDLEK